MFWTLQIKSSFINLLHQNAFWGQHTQIFTVTGSVCGLRRFSCFWLFATLMDRSPAAPSVHAGLSRQEYWRRVPCPPPGDSTTQGWDRVSCGSCSVGSLPPAPPWPSQLVSHSKYELNHVLSLTFLQIKFEYKSLGNDSKTRLKEFISVGRYLSNTMFVSFEICKNIVNQTTIKNPQTSTLQVGQFLFNKAW